MFSPQGTVKEIRQATVRFSEPMVSFGDPQLADPFDIRCPEKGRGAGSMPGAGLTTSIAICPAG